MNALDLIMSVLISTVFTGLTWGTERVGSVEIWKEHSLSSHRIQVGGLFRGLAKDPQISPAHLRSNGNETKRLYSEVTPQTLCTSCKVY